jgi:putative nucleotidyltransferase with HDIG domain
LSHSGNKVAIKKVSAERLAPGMYVHDLGAGWMDHPFLRSRFALTSPLQIEAIRGAGLEAVWIDTGLGIDEPEAASAESRAQAPAEPAGASPPRLAFEEEIGRAERIRERAQRAVAEVMREARLGRVARTGPVAEIVEEICESLARNSGALLSLGRLKTKDDYTFFHCVSVGTLLAAFARSLGMDADAVREAGLGGLLHDIGKTNVPDAVLNKPGRLSEAEFGLVKRHAAEGEMILQRSGEIGEIVLDIARHHHERVDGSGYPDSLKNGRISRLARMAAIADVYDAVTSERCYHAAVEPTEALRRMLSGGAFQLDRELVERFVRCVGIYPAGTLVRLRSERLAVVTEHRAEDLLHPKVRAFFDVRAARHIAPVDLELSSGGDGIASDESPARWQVDPRRYLPEGGGRARE